MDLTGAHPQHVTRAEQVIGEVDGVDRRTALDVHHEVEVEPLQRQELVRSTAVTDARQGVDLDVADGRAGREVVDEPNGILSCFYHRPSRPDRVQRRVPLLP